MVFSFCFISSLAFTSSKLQIIHICVKSVSFSVASLQTEDYVYHEEFTLINMGKSRFSNNWLRTSLHYIFSVLFLWTRKLLFSKRKHQIYELRKNKLTFEFQYKSSIFPPSCSDYPWCNYYRELLYSPQRKMILPFSHFYLLVINCKTTFLDILEIQLVYLSCSLNVAE